MIVYKATNKTNGKVYIGLTTKSLAKRRAGHHHEAKKLNSQLAFHRAIRKYGRDGFSWEVIEELEDTESLLAREIYWIDYYGSFGKNGYNMTTGGEGTFGYKVPQKTIDRIVKSRTENDSWLRGSQIGTSKLKEEDVLKIKDLIVEGFLDGDIAEMFDVARITISGIRRGLRWVRLGEDVSYMETTDTKYTDKFNKEDILEIKQMIKEGVSHDIIAERFNTTETTVSNIKMSKIYSHIGEDVSMYKSLRPGKAKLTEQDVREIRILLRDTKLLQREIGEIYSVDGRTINSINKNHTWKHVEINEKEAM